MDQETTVTDANVNPALDPDAGLSSSPDGISVQTDPTARTTSTVDVDLPKGGADKTAQERAEADRVAAEQQAAAAAAKGSEAGKAEPKTGENGQEGRFDQHPDWQRMVKERDEALLKAAKLEGAMEAAKATPAKTAGDAEESQELPFKDVTQLTKEQNLEWFEDDPVGYNANLFAQFNWERDRIEQQRRAEQDQERIANERKATVGQTLKAYTEANPDFPDLAKSGELDRYVKEHPGHNYISAHMALTMEKRIQAAATEAAAKAAKETEDRVTKNFQAKRNAATITDGATGPARAGDADKEMLKNSNKYGGPAAVLAERLRARRQAA